MDNDTNRFGWTDESNGKGVIYYMKDEWNNECPYDFKNIQFARWELSNPIGYRNDYDFDSGNGNWVQESTTFNSSKTGFYGLNGSDYMFFYRYDSYGGIDSDGSEHDGYYRYRVEYTISESPTYCYTFGKDADYSIDGNNYGNVIKEYKDNNKIQLNNIVFLGNSCESNIFGNNCHSNTFGNFCISNIFGRYCYKNSFGLSAQSNRFGSGCVSNIFGELCSNNIFGDRCQSNIFGDRCFENTFGNSCNYNSFGNSCNYNSFGNSCNYNSFGSSVSTAASLKDYCYYNHFDDGCSYNVIWNSSTTSSSVSLKNININRGVTGTKSNYNFINIDTLNAGYEIQVYNDESGNICIDSFPVPLTTNDIDLLWAKYFNIGGYGSSSDSATAVDDIINSIGVGDYDETEQ